jgi:hypothetical protein
MHTLDTSALHGNDVGTLSGSSNLSKEARIVGRNGHSDNQGTTNIEDKNTPEDTTNGLDDVTAGALGLRSSATTVRVSQ